ncbi:MAG: hypothetical protein RR440_00390 [Erysipelotrichaceae bacterium]
MDNQNAMLDIFVQNVMESAKQLFETAEDLYIDGIAVTANSQHIDIKEATEAIINEVVKVYKVKKTDAKKFVKITEAEDVY